VASGLNSEASELINFQISSRKPIEKDREAVIAPEADVDLSRFISRLREQLFQTATRLRLALGEHNRVVAVTQVATEDRSDLLSLELSLALVLLQNKPVLLVDGDLEHPGLHRLLDANPSPGFSEYIQTGHGPENFLSDRKHRNFAFLPAGDVPPMPVSILSSGESEQAFKALRRTFRYVVVNTGSIRDSSTAMSLVAETDGALLALARRKHRRKEVLEAKNDVESLNTSFFGVVLTEEI